MNNLIHVKSQLLVAYLIRRGHGWHRNVLVLLLRCCCFPYRVLPLLLGAAADLVLAWRLVGIFADLLLLDQLAQLLKFVVFFSVCWGASFLANLVLG